MGSKECAALTLFLELLPHVALLQPHRRNTAYTLASEQHEGLVKVQLSAWHRSAVA